jgi:hypothetical protein
MIDNADPTTTYGRFNVVFEPGSPQMSGTRAGCFVC